MAMWHQQQVVLRPRARGFHLIDAELLAPIRDHMAAIRIGLLHCFLQHSSASLALNENADPDVRADLERWFNATVREREPFYAHTCEGADDMPAHIKSVLIGPALSLPLSAGRLALGTWQGIYLCEHREQGGSRRVLLTLQGSTD